MTPGAAGPGVAPGACRPLVVTTHGYNSQCNPVLEARHAAACGADLLCFDVRGFGLSRAGCPIDPRGYVLTGLADPRTSILRGAVCDFVRAAQVAALLEAGGGGTVFHGRSFGGSLALMAQVVSGAANYLAVAVPTFGWAAGRRRLTRAGSGQEINDHLARQPADEAAVMHSPSPTSTPSTSPTASAAARWSASGCTTRWCRPPRSTPSPTAWCRGRRSWSCR